MECFICGKALTEGYLCKQHAKELHSMLKDKRGIVCNPDFRHHCAICGEFKNRIIVEYKGVGFFCELDIEEAFNNSETK